MKKAIKINLGGQVFHIDEDAYDKLKNYLDRISSHFSDIQESREILNDIEIRIAELLGEKLGDPNRVVTIREVDEIIEVMGRPEEIASEEATGEGEKEYSYESRSSRRLYRDPDNAVFGGVAAGLSAYFNVDLLLIRILFVVLILAGAGFPFLLYLVLWIAVPKAKTAAQKLEMQGEKVNVTNLEKKIREEYEDVKRNFKKARDSDAGQRTEDFFQEFFRVLGVIIVALAKIILAFIAVGFVIAGISLIAGLIGVAFFGAGMGTWGIFEFWDSDIHNFITPFIDPVNLTFIAIAGILLVLIPVLAIIYGLFKALFRFKAKDRSLGMSAFALWILALITVITLGIVEGREYLEDEEVTSTYEFEDLTGDILYINMQEDQIKNIEDKEDFDIDDKWFVIRENEVYGEVEIDIRNTDDEHYSLRIEKSSFGSNYNEALRYAENINYSFTRTDSLIVFDPYFKSEYEEKWRAQEVELTLYVPEGKSINFSKPVADHIDYVRISGRRYSPWRMAEKTWLMKENGLELIGEEAEMD